MQINLSTRQLRAFVALAEHRNFTRAARQCHLSQPAFSAVIQALEAAAGARLFDRHTRNVELTPEGRLMEESARRLLADFDGAFDNLREHIAGSKGRVAVAALPSLAAGWLAPVLAAYRVAHPAVSIDLYDVLSDECIDLVRRGRADLALTAAGSDMAELDAEVLCTDRFHLVCHRNHPLAREKRVRLQDLGGHPFVHMARTSSVRQHLDAALHPTRLVSLMEVEQLATLAGLISSGVGISVVPSLTLFQFKRPDLVIRPLQAPGLERTLYVVRRKGLSLSSAAQFMLEMIRSRGPVGPGVSRGPAAIRAPRRA